MDEIIKEKYITKSLEPVSLEKSEIIIEQMKKCVCRIYYNNCMGTGFFIKIPYKSKLLPVLMTNNHIIDLKNINNNKIITIFIKEENKERFIKIKEPKILYTNEKLDATFIELNEIEDNIKYYLELDNSIINSLQLNKDEIDGHLNNLYSGKSVYILNYPEEKNIMVSYGIVSSINNNELNHKCFTKEGSSGSPILLLKTNKVIGIHYGSSLTFDFNKGTLIIYVILDLINNVNNINLIDKKNKKKFALSLRNKDNNVDKEINLKIFYNSNVEEKINNFFKNKDKKNLYNPSSIFKIEYNIKQNFYSGIGFLVEIPIMDNYKIKGLITTYKFLNENILKQISYIKIYANKYIIKLELNKGFIFLDKFLQITFLENPNLELNYLNIEDKESNFIKKVINIKKNFNDYDDLKYLGKIEMKWGFYLIHSALTSDEFYGSPIFLSNNKVIGIHILSNTKQSVGINIQSVVQALRIARLSNLDYKNIITIEPKKLNKTDIYELKSHGLIQSENPNIFISPGSPNITPLWFYRTNYAWYWTPTEPKEDNISESNWLIIYPGGSLKVIGGFWDGIEPAVRNINLIHWLENTKLKFLM